jgi:hypothetical protein
VKKKLIKATQFRTRYFEKGSEPDIKTVKRWIDEGDVPGEVMGATYYVDLNRWGGSKNPLVNKVLAA